MQAHAAEMISDLNFSNQNQLMLASFTKHGTLGYPKFQTYS